MRINIDTEEDRKSFIIMMFTVLGCFVMAVFCIRGILEHRYIYSAAMTTAIIANLLNIGILIKKKNLNTAPHVTLLTMGALFLLLFLFIGKNGTGLFWFYTFPPLAIHLTNNKKGVIYSLSLAVLSIVFVLHRFGFEYISYESEQMIRFYAVYLVETSLIFIFEHARHRSHIAYMEVLEKMKDKNSELSAAEEELRINNEELQALNDNIEHQKRTIEESEKRLHTIIENQGEGFAITNNDGRFTFSNRAAEEILMVPKDKLYTCKLSDFLNEADLSMLQTDIKNRAIGEKTSYDLSIRIPSEEDKVILATLSHDIDKNRNIRGQIIIFRDITGKKKEEQKLKKLNRNLKKYFTVIEQSRLTILITDTAGNIEYTNPFFTEVTGYRRSEIIGENSRILKTDRTPQETFDSLWQALRAGNSWSGELINARKDGTYFIERATISPVTDENGNITDYVAIKEDITEFRNAQEKLDRQRTELESTYKNLKDSISYAKTIQDALLTKRTIIDHWLTEYFIFSQPKELVGGDFYYINKINQQIIVAVADCTGHGIPGAFMTLLSLTYLHENVKQNEIQTAGETLNQLRKNIKDIFKTFGSENNNGMDMILCVIDTENNTLQYAGANNPLYIVRGNELIEYEATKNPIGYYPSERDFENHLIALEKNDYLYLTTDGLQDQFGGASNRTFTRKRLKKLLLDISIKTASEQESEIKATLDNWKGQNKQVDDITIMGFKWR